jgi:ABC-type transport system involved in cytochrome c biogenesis permease subunit
MTITISFLILYLMFFVYNLRSNLSYYLFILYFFFYQFWALQPSLRSYAYACFMHVPSVGVIYCLVITSFQVKPM